MKTNHKISVMQLLLTGLCAVVVAVHRTVFQPSGSALFLVGLAAAAVVALCALGSENLRKKLLLKPAVPDKTCFAMLAGAGFLFLLSAGFAFVQQDAGTAMRIITAVFSAVCGAVTLMRLPLRDSGETAAVYSLVPIFYLSYYLLMFYRSNGDNPRLGQFGYEIAVLLFALLSTYSAIAGRFEKARPGFRAVGCSLGLVFILQELLFTAARPAQVFAIPGFSPASAAMLLACALLLCAGLFFPPVREVFPPKESETDEPDDQDLSCEEE